MQSWIFYPKFIPKDGRQMVNVNLLALFYFLILWFNILFFKYSRFLILTNYKKSKRKTQPKCNS
jgi:hypothetical protein